jgi:hypothetical protein
VSFPNCIVVGKKPLIVSNETSQCFSSVYPSIFVDCFNRIFFNKSISLFFPSISFFISFSLSAIIISHFCRSALTSRSLSFANLSYSNFNLPFSCSNSLSLILYLSFNSFSCFNSSFYNSFSFSVSISFSTSFRVIIFISAVTENCSIFL